MKFLKRPQSWLIGSLVLLTLVTPAQSIQVSTQQSSGKIKPGIQVLLEDSLHLVKG
ncbi:uncharacterized protein METZ01_LOCUS197292, partial [marine metagenome]